MGPRITPVFCTSDEFVRDYRWAGIVMAIVNSAVTMMLPTQVPEVSPLFYLGAIPASYAIAWLVVHQTWAMEPALQRTANRAFNNAYFHTFPMAYGVSAVVSALCMGFDLV